MTMPGARVRPVTDADRDAVIGIFNHYIATSFSAYPDKPVPPAFFGILKEGAHAFLVLEQDGEILGFGITRPYFPFSTFSRTATVTTFIDPSHRHQGFGTAMLDAMVNAARRKGIVMLLANVSSKNTESLAFHKKHGFFECGRMYEVGFKFNELFDVIWLQKDLAPIAKSWKGQEVSLPG